MADLPNTPPCERKLADTLTLVQQRAAMESTQARKKIGLHRCELTGFRSVPKAVLGVAQGAGSSLVYYRL